ncbi:MAG: hypothetical protein ACFFAU_20940 [Candidatus Hodarchaeota archaeon]
MSWIFEKISEFKVLVYSQTLEGEIYLSKHKLLVLIFYSITFALTFLHFANIPPNVITACQESSVEGATCSIPASRFSGLAVLLYLYITFVAVISIFRGGYIPNFLSRPQIPSVRNRYKILLVVIFLFFGGTVFVLAFASIYLTLLLLVFIGPFLYVVWMILEPYFLLSGVLAIIRIIDSEYHIEGFSKRSKRSLIIIFVLGYLTPIIFAIFLFLTSTDIQFSEVSILGFSFTFYRPALSSFSRTITTVLSLSLLLLIIWWLKDRIRKEKSQLRERKKGMLPWFLGLTLILIVMNVVPLIASTRGSLQEVTSLIDILSLFAAVIMGLWNTLGVEQITEPLNGLKSLNPIERISRLHPYTKALFLLVISMLAFYSSLENSTISALTGLPDTLKLQKLNLLAGFIGWAFIVLLWRYKGQSRSTTPGLLRTTQYQLEESFSKFKSIIARKSITEQMDSFEEE